MDGGGAYIVDVLESMLRATVASNQGHHVPAKFGSDQAHKVAPVLSDEARAENLRKQLAAQHGVDIYYVKIPELPGKPPCRIDYSGTAVEVLAAAPPNKLGNYFAKKAG